MSGPSQALVRNWRLKLSALGLSILLWALVQTEPSNRETFAAVPVQVQIADTAWTTSGPPSPATVEVRLGGPPNEIIGLAREGTSIRVPIASVGSRDTVITLRRDWVQVGQRPGVTVESVSPAEIRLSFEPARTRLLPLATRYVGDVPDRLALASRIVLSPQLVRVRGPASRVEGLDSVLLAPFDLSEVDRSGSYTVPIDTAGLLGSSIVPRSATLNLRVEELVERLLDDIPVEAEVEPGEAEVVVEPAAVQLRLSGARSLVTALDPSRLRVRVPPGSLQGMEPGEERLLLLQIEGVPELVIAEAQTDRVIVRRAIDQGEGPGLP